MRIKPLKLSVFRVVWTASILIAMMSYAGERLSGFLQDTPRVSVKREFPTSAPREENRVSAAEGFSLIAPEGWKAIRGENQLLFVPGNRSSRETSIRVTLLEDRYRHPVPLPETRLFQDQPAYSVVRTEPAGLGEPERHELYVVFERERQLFELCYQSTRELKPGVRENVCSYLETFVAAPAE